MAVTRVALVTGGGAGIGRAACLALARDGFGVVCADLDGARASAVADAIVSAGGVASSATCDVSREESWPVLLERARALGSLDVLVSNAAVFPRLAFDETRLADFDRVMSINLRAVFLGVTACVPEFRANGGGALVVMSSGSGLPTAVSNPMQVGFALYGASKAALDRWTLGIAPELAPANIAVNVLCPGAPVLTEGYNALSLGAEAPAGSVSAECVADAIAHLARCRPPEGTGKRRLATDLARSWH